MGDHDFGPAGGEVALDTEGNVLLYVPENTFKRPTTVTWSLTEGVPGCPVVDIEARDFGGEVKLFEKHVQIIFKHVPVTSGQTGSVTVEGGRFPRQNFEQPEIAGSKPEVVDSKPETETDSKREIALSRAKSSKVEDTVGDGLESKKTNYARGAGVLFTDGNLLSSQSEQLEYSQAEHPQTEHIAEVETTAEVQSFFHTFYTFRDATTLVIYSKHFSKFSPNFRCPKHQKEFNSPFVSNITAAIFRSREPVKVNDEYRMSVKVVLQIEDDSVPIGQPNHYDNPWRIHNHDDYTCMKTMDLTTPPNSTLIQPGSQFDVRVKFKNRDTDGWTFHPEYSRVQESLENCIPCRESFHKILPEAAELKFIWKPPDDMRTNADDYGAGVIMRNVTPRPRAFSFKIELEIIPFMGTLANFFSKLLWSSKRFITCELVDIVFDTPTVDVQQKHSNRVQSDLTSDSNNNANSPTGVAAAETTEGSSSRSLQGNPVMSPRDGDIVQITEGLRDTNVNRDPVGPDPSPKLSDLKAENPVRTHPEDQPRVYELTDKHLTDISERLTLDNDIETLGYLLGIKRHHFQAAFKNHPHCIQSAAGYVLDKWRKGFDSATVAYKEMWSALGKAKLNEIRTDVLKNKGDPPP